MPGARPRIKPLSAGGSSRSSLDEVSQLELHLQRQLEDDVARIFDESIYSDLEVVCGKLKILTHSCILKARTHTFYHKLETILHVNIGRNTFDEIYSFISDVYTECDIQHQENEIINFLNEHLQLKAVAVTSDKRVKPEDLDESDAYATPNCVSPEDRSLQKTLSSSPSTELTKEYYALVPIEGHILDKELIEQDELSTAFQSFIQVRNDIIDDSQIHQRIKPTTLSLNSSHISKINNHSIICDITKDVDSNTSLFENDNNKINVTSQVRKHISEINKNKQLVLKKSHSVDTGSCEQAYSPDSLVADEPSSSSDYLSAAHSVSPGAASFGCFSHAPAGEKPTKMNNNYTVSDSGFDSNGMLESLNSHKDVTLTDVSLTESTFHDLLNDEIVNCHDPASNPIEKKQPPKPKFGNTQSLLASTYKTSLVEMSGRSSKEEKQRQNEEIVILESSSLSSETGSWESVFPPKMPEKDLCEKFINIERQNCTDPAFISRAVETTSSNVQYSEVVQKTPCPSSCFIDAASLADEEEGHQEQDPLLENIDIFRPSSRPMPCVPKQDISPIDFSESNDNEDSLEQPDPDSIQKDISPTIFEMVLVSEDSVPVEQTSEIAKVSEYQNTQSQAALVLAQTNDINNSAKSATSQTVYMTSTPNNSIISLKTFKTYDSEGSDSDAIPLKREPTVVERVTKQTSLAHTIRQDELLDLNISPMPKRKIENIPLVSGAYTFSEEVKPEKTSKPSSYAAAWVVDMSKMPLETNINKNNKKPGEKTCNSLKSSSLKSGSNSDGCKSRSSVDSDSSEKSTHKFYIDLSTLPDALAPEQNSESESNEKKTIFSMFIDLGENSPAVKEMPARLSSSLNTKKNSKLDNKSTNAKVKTTKKPPSVIKSADDAFEKLESLCNNPEISISEILQNPDKNIITKEEKTNSIEIKDYSRGFSREGIKTSIKEEPGDDEPCDLFVKLSDLDKPVQMNDSALAQRAGFERMTRSIPDHNSSNQLTNWGESSHTSSRSIDIISSFHSENALSLNRLFPHLKNDISQSMPGSLSGRTRSPLRLGMSSSSGDRDELASDVSEISSVQSSMCRSVIENSTTEDTSQTSSLISNCQSRLGQDLLRMFLEEIAPDVIVEVSGRRIKAHKCILSSRCQYFAGILSGGWVESAGNVIALPPFSFSVVHFALCHIYSGVSMIPESISIVELATIADMLGLEGLKEAIMFTLKAKYCHHFHRPCQVCTAGVLECFTLSSVYGLDDLYRRCLRWITKHFHKVWPTKAFATLPSELLDKCYQEHILNLTTDNLIDMVYDCGLTVASLHRSRWAEVVARLCRRVVTGAGVWAGPRLSAVVRSMANAPSVAPPPAVHALDECLAAAVHHAPTDELCRAYAYLCTLPELTDPPVSLAHAHASSLRRRCESAIIRSSPRVTDSPAFRELPVERRRRLRDLMARYVNCNPLSAPAPRKPVMNGLDERVRASFLPRNRVEPRVRPAPQERVSTSDEAPPRVRTTKAQEKRAEFNMSKSAAAKPNERNGKPRTARNIANAKPRYLEPRKDRKLGKIPSSSEESRNSSPVLARGAAAPRRAPCESRESLASRPRTADPSSNSISETLKYATYTKTRHTTEGPAPPLQPPKCHATSTASNRSKTTKIPVYLSQTHVSSVRSSAASLSNAKERKRVTQNERVAANSSPLSQRSRTSDVKPSGSLMMATKSSSAKMVPKAVKESSKGAKHNVHGVKPVAKHPPLRSPPVTDIPVMERSGTFLKDEPTFGDKSTIDIDEQFHNCG